MRRSAWVLVAAVAVLAWRADPSRAEDPPKKDPPKKQPLVTEEVVGWQKADAIGQKELTRYADGSEVVVLCLVTTYDPATPSKFGPNDKTPAQMLDIYLAALRQTRPKWLGDEKAVGAKKLKVVIAECGPEVRKRAATVFDWYGKKGYDESMPVLVVFHKGKWVQDYTYAQPPGKGGDKLQALVEKLLAPPEKDK